MPAILVTIGIYIISSVIAKIFVALGIGLLSYYGLYELVQELLNQVQDLMTSLPPQVFQIISLAGIPQAMSIIGSAVLTRAAIKSVEIFFGVRS
ncbi:DUF2523 domain-containing protein [Pseudomonas sp. WS 5011]|uniref:DUF2523 domain-containing protein n=1 Tax=Pseudomonas sp. WS 5011 TaxID=2717477 RepID=UPI001473D768|nr:DUF2523 domain-containing protein [Pseudomonas sp. WS 5011]NMY53446.1 DUF2523 domain-containing protein [Pseudomonas sp. WS 5011]